VIVDESLRSKSSITQQYSFLLVLKIPILADEDSPIHYTKY